MHCLQYRGPYAADEKIKVKLPETCKIKKIGISRPHKRSVPIMAYCNNEILKLEKEELELQYSIYEAAGLTDTDEAKKIKSRLKGLEDYFDYFNPALPTANIYINNKEYILTDNNILEFDNLNTSSLNIKWLQDVNSEAVIDIMYEEEID